MPSYEDLLHAKAEAVCDKFFDALVKDDVALEVIPSPKRAGHRGRCRFAIVADAADLDAADARGRAPLRCAVYEKGEVRALRCEDAAGVRREFPAASDAIARTMPGFTRAVNCARGGGGDGGDDGESALTRGLAAVEFLASRDGEVVVTMWYAGNAGNLNGDVAESKGATWDTWANELMASVPGVVGVVARRRGRKPTTNSTGRDHVWETMTIPSFATDEEIDETGAGGDAGRAKAKAKTPPLEPPGLRSTLTYKQVEGAFSCPNGDVAEETARWLRRVFLTLVPVRSRPRRGERRSLRTSPACVSSRPPPLGFDPPFNSD